MLRPGSARTGVSLYKRHLAVRPEHPKRVFRQNAGTCAELADEEIFHDSILHRIYNQIVKPDVIVADVSSRNANVFYEAGYAHALGKTVILLTKAAALPS